MSDAVHLTSVSSAGEAQVICGLLRTAGVECAYRQTNAAAGAFVGSGGSGGSQEILVREDQLELAREMLAGSENA